MNKKTACLVFCMLLASSIVFADNVFELTEKSKILCAERKGSRGTEGINRIIINKLKKEYENWTQPWFPGELLMITKNLNALDLSNGDNGVVVQFDGDDTLWFMIKKGKGLADDGDRSQGIFTKNGYAYYPLYEIPSDAIEVSYAMTIHKSQGSGYGAIMILLPKNPNSPLLNKQIIYTALTRTEGIAKIIAPKESIEAAITNKIERDTKIILNNVSN